MLTRKEAIGMLLAGAVVSSMPAAAFADDTITGDINLKELSDEELLALREAIAIEISDRGLIKKHNLPVGIYHVGSDIPEGTYLFTVDKIQANVVCLLQVHDEKGDYVTSSLLEEGDTVKVDAIDGYSIELQYASFIVEPFSIEW